MRGVVAILVGLLTTVSILAQAPQPLPPPPPPGHGPPPGVVPQQRFIQPPGAIPIPMPAASQPLPVPPPPVGLGIPGEEGKPLPFWGEGWCGGVELGVNGTEGNSRNLKLRTGVNLKHQVPDQYVWKGELLYNYTSANAKETENRLLAETRCEWPLKGTPWSTFVDGSFEYNEFTTYDILVATHAGVGYQLVATDDLKLKLRTGAGGSWQIGGPKDGDFAPEALLGLDVEWKLSDRQKICSTVDFYPDLKETGQYRAQAKVAYEVLIDPTWNLTLKIGATDRYFSNVSLGKRRNDVEYFGVLLWKF